MKTYETYKDSGIEWIGQVPEHWEIKKLKYLALIGNGKDHKDVWDENGEFSIIGTGGEFGKANAYLFDKPSVILGRKGTIDKPMFIDKPFWAVDTAYFTISKDNTDTKYLFYLSNTINFGFYKYGSTVPSMNQEQLKEIYFSVPPTKQEQTAIANYLDKKTAAIDQLIANKKRLVELYQEEKNAIINQAVTKGINLDPPDGQAGVKLRDSGIEWLGDIPEHWVIKKLNWCFKTIGSGTTPKAGNQEYYFNGTHNWLLTGDLNDGEIHKTTKKITDKALKDYSSLKEYGENSVVIAMYGATIGKLGVLKIPTTVNQACCVLSEPTHLNYDFTFFLLLNARQEIINMSYGGGQPNISQELLKQFKIQVPPKEEQTQIVQHIEKESARIDAKITKAEQYINLLTEYRTALISEVVTGKVKVLTTDFYD